MDIQDATFKDMMGFNVSGGDVFYEDDAADTTIPDIQVFTMFRFLFTLCIFRKLLVKIIYYQHGEMCRR
jgi:hypothetical protein